jgi:EAL domain-containing protein (putative c-di-GMP-specific phosphodiesterase class I)
MTDGGEFSIIMRGTNSKNYISSIVQRIRRLINAPAHFDGKTVFLSAYFGVVLDIRAPIDASHVMALAADAMRTSKKEGMGSVTFLSAEEGLKNRIQQSRNNLLAARADIRRGLTSLEFAPYFQPIYQISPSRLAGFEALARWNHPNGLMPPSGFILQAEEAGLIAKIDRIIISKAIKIAKKWSEDYPGFPFFVSTNVSAALLREPNFIPFMFNLLEKTGLDPKYFIVECTEEVFIENFDDIAEKLNLLRDRGTKVILDDFGTNSSSLQYISRLPLDYLKVDKSFINQLFSSAKTELMSKAIIEMACMFGIGVMAEEVDNANQLDWLAKNGGTKAQGYFFSAPVPSEEALQILADASAFSDVTQR